MSGLARTYGISFATARKWVRIRGLHPLLDTPAHAKLLRDLISKAPVEASRRRIDLELGRRLADFGDRKLLARAIVDEFSMRYIFKRSSDTWARYVLLLTILMYDLPPVQEISALVGTKCRTQFRTTKSGVRVPCWIVNIHGYRAYRILQLVRPYLVGQKAFQSDIALQNGPIIDRRTSLRKDLYKQQLLASLPL
jgi:hypothetical protein